MTVNIDGYIVTGTPEEIEHFIKIHRFRDGIADEFPMKSPYPMEIGTDHPQRSFPDSSPVITCNKRQQLGEHSPYDGNMWSN